jgi:drug/metabolite transporter (DMT)-like permease
MAVCVRLATPHMAATQVACVRFVGSFVVLVLATRARQLRPAPGNAGRLLLRGVLGGAAISCYYVGISRAGAALATASELRRSESASLVTIWFMAVGALLTAPSFAAGAPSWSAALVFSLAGVVLTSASGQWLLHHGLGFVSATAGSLAAATGVLTTAILEGLLLGQHLPARVIAGGLLMLAAVGLAGRARPPAVADEAIAD